MRTKYNKIKISAIFIATATSAMPLYSQAQTKDLPSIELNFDVLERLNQSTRVDTDIQTDKKLQPELKDAEHIVPPTLKPAELPASLYNAPKEIPAIIIKKEPEVVPLPVEILEEKQPDKKKNIFSSLFNKIPFISKKPETPAVSDTVKDEAKSQETQDESSAKALAETKQTSSDNKKPKKQNAKTKKESPKDSKKQAKKTPVQQPTKPEASKLSESTPTIPSKPEQDTTIAAEKVTKEEPITTPPAQKPKQEAIKSEPTKTNTKKAEGADDSKWQQFLESSRKKAAEGQADDIKVKEKVEATPALPMVVTQTLKSENKQAEPTTQQNTVENPKPITAEQKTKISEDKAEKLSIRDEVPVQTTTPSKAIEEPIPTPVPTEAKKTLPTVAEKSARSIQTAELEAIAPKDEITPEEKDMLSSVMKNIPSISNDKNNIKTPAADITQNALATPNKAPANSTSGDKIVTIDKNTERKLGETIDRNMAANHVGEVPPVPEISTTPIEMSKLTPPENAESITIKEVSTTPEQPETKNTTIKQTTTENKNILMSITFDGNNISISPTDNDKLTKIIKQLNSSQRLKIMSYAKGIDGEVNSSRRIALQRAIAIRSHLIEAGLEKTRINVQAVGNNPNDEKSANSANIYVVE